MGDHFFPFELCVTICVNRIGLVCLFAELAGAVKYAVGREVDEAGVDLFCCFCQIPGASYIQLPCSFRIFFAIAEVGVGGGVNDQRGPEVVYGC